jgi:hypothetical protein
MLGGGFNFAYSGEFLLSIRDLNNAIRILAVIIDGIKLPCVSFVYDHNMLIHKRIHPQIGV